MRRLDEVKAGDTFRSFVEYAEERLRSADDADTLVEHLRRDADTYRHFAQLDKRTPEGSYYRRVIENLELAVTTPVFLWLVSENHRLPPEQQERALRSLESWAIRRTLLGLTTKDMNRFMVTILRFLDATPHASVGDALRDFLSEQTADTRVWPADTRMREELPRRSLYGAVRQDRLRTVLSAVELRLR